MIRVLDSKRESCNACFSHEPHQKVIKLGNEQQAIVLILCNECIHTLAKEIVNSL